MFDFGAGTLTKQAPGGAGITDTAGGREPVDDEVA
jgi:hypothetical protein